MAIYIAAGTDLQEPFRQYILGKHPGVKFNSTYVFVFLLYGSFLHSKILAFGVSEVIRLGLRQLFGL